LVLFDDAAYPDRSVRGDTGSGLLPVELCRRGGGKRNRARGRWMSTSSSEEMREEKEVWTKKYDT
jgi:hypothetical protein